MVELLEVKEVLVTLCEDNTISKSVLETLKNLKDDLTDETSAEICMKIDSALGKLEDLTLDPNLSADVRTRLWNLTSLLETAKNSK